MKRIIKLSILLSVLFLVGFADPTKPPSVLFAPKTIASGQPFTISAIFIYPNNRFAIMNNQIVKEGDRIDQFIVTRISTDTVELVGPQNSTQVLHVVTPVVQKVAR